MTGGELSCAIHGRQQPLNCAEGGAAGVPCPGQGGINSLLSPTGEFQVGARLRKLSKPELTCIGYDLV